MSFNKEVQFRVRRHAGFVPKIFLDRLCQRTTRDAGAPCSESGWRTKVSVSTGETWSDHRSTSSGDGV